MVDSKAGWKVVWLDMRKVVPSVVWMAEQKDERMAVQMAVQMVDQMVALWGDYSAALKAD
jgi:hypothetical protein